MKYLLLALLPLLMVPGTKVNITHNQILNEQLNRLIWCESRGKQFTINLHDPDTASYSYFQFKLETFNHFAKRYGLPNDDIFSYDEQWNVAKNMLEEGLGQSMWVVCWKTMGLDGGKGVEPYISEYLKEQI